jgi:hypothetical protein
MKLVQPCKGQVKALPGGGGREEASRCTGSCGTAYASAFPSTPTRAFLLFYLTISSRPRQFCSAWVSYVAWYVLQLLFKVKFIKCCCLCGQHIILMHDACLDLSRPRSPPFWRKIGRAQGLSHYSSQDWCMPGGKFHGRKGTLQGQHPAICPGASCATCMGIANNGHHRVLPITDDWVTV